MSITDTTSQLSFRMDSRFLEGTSTPFPRISHLTVDYWIPGLSGPGPIALLKSLEKRQNHFRNVQYDIPPPPLQFNLKNQSQETCIFYVSTPRFQKQRKTAHNITLYPSCLSASAELKGGKKKILSAEHEHIAQEIECLLQRVFNRAVSALISDML